MSIISDLSRMEEDKSSWFRMYLRGCEKIVQLGLQKRQYDVLFLLFANLHWNTNIIQITQAQIADELGIHHQTVSMAIKVLVAKNIIKIVDRRGRCNSYMLNREFGAMGGRRND